jgi:hypothetical protein
MRNNIFFVAIVLFIATLLYTLSRKEFLPIPADEQHIRINVKEKCLECHDRDRIAPLKKEHPPKDQCFECHKLAKK